MPMLHSHIGALPKSTAMMPQPTTPSTPPPSPGQLRPRSTPPVPRPTSPLIHAIAVRLLMAVIDRCGILAAGLYARGCGQHDHSAPSRCLARDPRPQ
ncbi:hypothetical protein ACP70R_031588 [Stipagrostis hirtigluma subsp. patula]